MLYGKPFTSVLNIRLNKYVDEYGVVGRNKLVLKNLMELLIIFSI